MGMSNIQKPNHQDLINELITRMARYEQVKNEESLLLKDLNSLQKKLYEAGINYKISINLGYEKSKENENRLSHLEKQLLENNPNMKINHELLKIVGVQNLMNPPSKDNEVTRKAIDEHYKTKERSNQKQLSYDLVLKTADSIMKEGRAISVPVIAKRLNSEKDKNSIRKYLEEAVEKELYEKRKGTTYAFPVKFDIYQPKGKDLPFLPPVVSTNEYKTMVDVSSKVVINMKRKFTQKEFYQKLKPEVEKEGIALKKIQMTVPSVLHNYVVRGILKTEDQNTYTKSFKRKIKTETSKKSHSRISVEDGTKRGKAILISPKDEREALSDFYRK